MLSLQFLDRCVYLSRLTFFMIDQCICKHQSLVTLLQKRVLAVKMRAENARGPIYITFMHIRHVDTWKHVSQYVSRKIGQGITSSTLKQANKFGTSDFSVKFRLLIKLRRFRWHCVSWTAQNTTQDWPQKIDNNYYLGRSIPENTQLWIDELQLGDESIGLLLWDEQKLDIWKVPDMWIALRIWKTFYFETWTESFWETQTVYGRIFITM